MVEEDRKNGLVDVLPMLGDDDSLTFLHPGNDDEAVEHKERVL